MIKASWLFAGGILLAGSAHATEAATPVRGFLCDSAAHAMQFADILAQGEIEEMAKDRVGRIAKAEVCGRYAGLASVESRSVLVKDGIAYQLTAFRFEADGRLAWLAELSFTPPKAAWDL